MSKKLTYLFPFLIAVVCFMSPVFAFAEECIIITLPVENAMVIGKRPEVKGTFRCSLASGSYVIMLDGVDITQILDVDAEGFTHRPEMMVTTGEPFSFRQLHGAG